jgi:hypothetical protein
LKAGLFKKADIIFDKLKRMSYVEHPSTMEYFSEIEIHEAYNQYINSIK